ncbi:MAG: serine/threonine-protein kinase, partial [Phycisphaerae bacterium]
MPTCATCSCEVDGGISFCPQCGSALPGADADGITPTVTTPQGGPRRPAGGGADGGDADRGGNAGRRRTPAPRDRALSRTSQSIDEARFTAGAVLSERYRIVGLLGKGGMGEVYRADDLKLRQPVALKFLPETLAQDAARLERFHHEVRIAREVSHPNVCRVYDIGEAEGQPFITMEFVDGEDLAKVLRRMGRPSPDKALQIARQLCAGLAAAHDKGVLHRDLKPHNVMIDERGRVRITDFGLAGFVEDLAGRDVGAGTPAYMAPEQLAGRGVSVKSDVYSLGLVLYELFTGRRAFEGNTMAEQLRARDASSLSALSATSGTIDPAVERVILRCLDKEPSARPSSALAVAAALPGGDPLAAALAAGETPDPSMVAAAGDGGGMRPALAVSVLAATLVTLVVVIWLADRSSMLRRVPLPHSPAVLAAKAREMLVELGHAEPPVDTAYGFSADSEYILSIRESDKSAGRWDRLAGGGPPAVTFWYRQSPRYLGQLNFFGGRVSRADPPADQSGMAEVELDPSGKLRRLVVVPPQVEASPTEPGPPEWASLFSRAGFDIDRFTRVDSLWSPPVWADARAAWEGTYPDCPDVPVRVEAAAHRGKPVYFEQVYAWTRPDRMRPPSEAAGQRAGNAILIGLFMTVLVGGFLMARRNIRLGRSDRRGALRLMAFVLVTIVLAWLFRVHHVPT